ncbi:MAG: glycosyltransferase [Deltaproteobacteria bacterium]|nr:glycosyltransferase [Deltaproteobacteria bacterium]
MSPELSILIPAFNEMHRLPATIDSVLEYFDEHPHTQLVLVNDGSTDGTGGLIEAAAGRDGRVVPVLCAENRGKGAALRSGVRRCTGDAVVFFDADLEYGLTVIDELQDRLASGADLAIGARDKATSDARRAYTTSRRLASSAFNVLVKATLDLGIKDTQCGLKMFRRDVAHALFDVLDIDGFGFDVEILCLARLWSLRIDLVPLEMTNSPGSSVHVVRDGLKMARDIGRIWHRSRTGRYPSRPPHL